MAYTDLSFCWHGIVTPDPAAARAFYAGVLGWNAQDVPMGDGTTTVLDPGDGVPRCHLGAPQEAGVPAHWESYLRVADVDAAAAAAVRNGGAILVPPTDIPPGRFAVVTSPSGAAISLFHEADASASDAPEAEGIHWTELHSHELEADLAWLKASFGIETGTMPMPNGTYYLLKQGERMIGGALSAMHADAPSMWLVWLKVGDVDGTADRVRASGGKVLGDRMDMPGVGAMYIAADPTGGVFGIIEPTA
ncbi:MAG: VOC family protein [Alphaproteobacteria bacterium]|nr:VOC family protein [Alphaproteobacteria bacterium]